MLRAELKDDKEDILIISSFFIFSTCLFLSVVGKSTGKLDKEI